MKGISYKAILLIISQVVFITANIHLPVIGILTIPKYTSQGKEDYTQATIDANYARWLEASGAESLAFHPWLSSEELDLLLNKLDGVLIQDTDIPINLEAEYFQTLTSIFNRSKQYTSQGEVFPIFGINRGFHALHAIVAGTKDVITANLKAKTPSSLKFDVNRAQTTRMFSDFDSKRDYTTLSSNDVIASTNESAIVPGSYTKYPVLREFFRITALGISTNNKNFVAAAEGYNYAIYGTQFNPELISYDRNTDSATPQGLDSIRISRSLGNFFVNQARLNYAQFEDLEINENYIHPYTSLGVKDSQGKYHYIFNKPVKP